MGTLKPVSIDGICRGTVSRLLAYSTDRMGVPKALGGGATNSGITEKLVPAVAKFAQDGSQDAR